MGRHWVPQAVKHHPNALLNICLQMTNDQQNDGIQFVSCVICFYEYNC